MVRAVMGLASCCVLAAAPAAAMGPDDPFTPPGPVRLEIPVPAKASVGTLAGVRLGRAPAALIDGEWIAEGTPVRGARLLRVHPSGADLRHADGRVERLLLFSPDRPLPAAGLPASDPALRDTP